MRFYIYHRDFPADLRPPQAGVCKAVHGLANALAAAGHGVVVICEGQSDSVTSRGPNYEVRCFAGSVNGKFGAKLSPSLQAYVASSPPDSLYLLNAMFHPGVYAMSTLLRHHKLRYVVAPHDPYHPVVFARRPYVKWPYWYLRERPMLQAAEAVQVLDHRHGRYLERLGVHTPIIECLNGYQPADELPEADLRWSDSGSRPSAIFVGRLDANNKGLDLLIKAVASLPPDSRPLLTLQGPDGGDGAMLGQLAQTLGVSTDVRLLPPDYTVSPGQLMVRHDIFCLVSRFEGFGLAALEAMLAGRVLMVSDITGIAPHVRACGCGVVVDADPASVRDGLNNLLNRRSEWQAMGLAGRRYVLEHLRWDKIAASMWKQYTKLVPAPDVAPAAGQVPALR